MQVSDLSSQRKVVFTQMDNYLGPQNSEMRQVTPVLGNKIKAASQIKVHIKVKMPSVDRNKRNSSLFKCPASIQNLFFSPTNITKKSSGHYYSPKKQEYHLTVSKDMSVNKKRLLPDLKHSMINPHSQVNIYSELLGFLIKVQVDYIPIYQKIDLHRKGKIELQDFEVFFIKTYPGLEFLEHFQRLLRLNSWFSKEDFVLKRNFLAICAGVMYKRPQGKDYKSIFIDQNELVLMASLEKYSRTFKRLADGKHIEVSRLICMKKFVDSKAQKSLQTVFSEPVDLQRFINCYPFFKWVLKSNF